MAKQEQVADPGFGRTFKGAYKRLINDDGSFNVDRKGAIYGLSNAYHYLLKLSWTHFLLLLVLAYVALNCVFALGYLLIGIEDISGTVDGGWIPNFSQAFFFSTQTFTTLGYGAMSPISPSASFLASFEAMVGLLGFAMATGLLYGRFSLPNARLLFSNNMIVAPYKDINALMFRVVNQRSNVLLEMNAAVMMVLTDVSQANRRRRFYRLNLEISSINFFPTAWTIVHPIDEDSPLHGLSAKELENQEAELVISLKGFDDKFSQMVFVRKSYTWDEAVVGARFVPNFTRDEDGNVVVDVQGVHNYEAARLNS